MTAGAIMMACSILLGPGAGEKNWHTTVIRINKRDPATCTLAAGKWNAKQGQNVCSCWKPGEYPKTMPSLTPTKDKKP